MVSILGKKNSVFPKKKVAVGQLFACSLQLNFKAEIKCLRIVKRLKEVSNWTNLQSRWRGGGEELARFGGEGE